MGVLERLEEQRRYEIHQRKLARTRNVVKTQEKEKRLPKKFDPDTLATANRQRAARSPSDDVDDAGHDGSRHGSEYSNHRQPGFDDALQPQDGNRPQRRVSSAARRKQAKAAAQLAQPKERAPSREQAAKQRLQEYAETEMQARSAHILDAQDRITQRQEAALQKYHRRRTGEKQEADASVKDAPEQRRVAAMRRKQRQAAAERNEAALEKHRARQRAIREGKAVAAVNATRISTAPEQRDARQPREPRVVRGAPRVANLDSKPKTDKRWVTVAEATTPSPAGKASKGGSDGSRQDETTAQQSNDSVSPRTQKYSHEDRRALIDRLECAEQTVVHLRQRVHDLETRQVVKPTEVADDDALEAALARALAAEVALENTQSELSIVRRELTETCEEKQALEKRLEAAAANVAAADEALLMAQQGVAAEDSDTVQCGSQEEEEAFEDDFEDDEQEQDAVGKTVGTPDDSPQVDRTPQSSAAASRGLTVPNSIRSIQGSIGGWTPEA